jgi:hypothetical protein
MQHLKTENIFLSIVDILTHIEAVQKDVSNLSERSALCFHKIMEDNKLEANSETLDAFQYQDVISQQLSAVSDAIETIKQSIDIYLSSVKEDQATLSDSMDKLSSRLTKSLEVAKAKKDAYSGNAIDANHGASVEFF